MKRYQNIIRSITYIVILSTLRRSRIIAQFSYLMFVVYVKAACENSDLMIGFFFISNVLHVLFKKNLKCHTFLLYPGLQLHNRLVTYWHAYNTVQIVKLYFIWVFFTPDEINLNCSVGIVPFLNSFILCFFRKGFLQLFDNRKKSQILTQTNKLEGDQGHWWGKFIYIVM